jgi:threonyl-tRNA synthetase
MQAFASVKTSSTNWLGQVTNDPLQRVYGIAFPDKAQLKQWQEFQEQAKQRDHRNLGTKQELFFFHQVHSSLSLSLL